MSVINKYLIDALTENIGAELSVSGDIAHMLEEEDDLLGVRVFSHDVCEVAVCESRNEVTIVMGQADLNYSVEQLFSDLMNKTIDSVVASHTNEKGGMNTVKRFKNRLKKQLISEMSNRLKQ